MVWISAQFLYDDYPALPYDCGRGMVWISAQFLYNGYPAPPYDCRRGMVWISAFRISTVVSNLA